MATNDYFRPIVSRNSSSSRKARYTSGGGDDLFLNLANDTSPATAKSNGGAAEYRSNTAPKTIASSVPSPGAHPLFARRDLSSQSRPVSTTPDDAYYRTRRSLYAPSDSASITRNPDAARDYHSSPLASYGRPMQPSSGTSERKDGEYARLARQRISLISGTPPVRTSFQTSDAQDGSRSNDTTARARRLQGDDESSVVSDQAPSTVWDELEELKTRIHSLEKGRPSTSTASRYEPGEHQRTSTLTSVVSRYEPTDNQRTSTLTSIHSHYEPRRTSTLTSRTPVSDFRLESQTRSRPTPTRTPTITPQQLLQTALANAMSTLPRNLYNALDLHAQGVLDLALGMDSSDDSPSSRTLRRRLDNLCRNLTEFCIALCDNNGAQTTTSASGTGTFRDRSSTNPLLDNGDSSPLVYTNTRRTLILDSDTDRPISRMSNTTTEPRRSIVLSRASTYNDAATNNASSSSRQANAARYIPRSDSPPQSTTSRSRTTSMTLASEPHRESLSQSYTPRLYSLTSGSITASSPRHVRESLDYTKSHPMPDPSASPAAKHVLRGGAGGGISNARAAVKEEQESRSQRRLREENGYSRGNEDGDDSDNDVASVGSGRTGASARTDRTETGRRSAPAIPSRASSANNSKRITASASASSAPGPAAERDVSPNKSIVQYPAAGAPSSQSKQQQQQQEQSRKNTLASQLTSLSQPQQSRSQSQTRIVSSSKNGGRLSAMSPSSTATNAATATASRTISTPTGKSPSLMSRLSERLLSRGK